MLLGLCFQRIESESNTAIQQHPNQFTYELTGVFFLLCRAGNENAIILVEQQIDRFASHFLQIHRAHYV